MEDQAAVILLKMLFLFGRTLQIDRVRMRCTRNGMVDFDVCVCRLISAFHVLLQHNERTEIA